jgi:hypothetical protein
MKTRVLELQKDANDVYQYLRYFLLPFFALYLLIVVVGQHEVHAEKEVVSYSRDWGLTMTVSLVALFGFVYSVAVGPFSKSPLKFTLVERNVALFR